MSLALIGFAALLYSKYSASRSFGGTASTASILNVLFTIVTSLADPWMQRRPDQALLQSADIYRNCDRYGSKAICLFLLSWYFRSDL
ncbi:hypothetical protein MYA83_13475 [Pseudomonas palleroniana]|uniref:hypothetical protein n=1 Tax=Pseudomonas palleroniana TaxID=191390 RepID=UPI003AFFA09F